MSERTPTDGRPFYCDVCGAGFAEFMACETGDCRLESEEEAKERQRYRQPSNEFPEMHVGGRQ